VPTASAATGAEAVPAVFVDGKGFGHGVGMAQDGAFWMGKAGASTNDILGHFYPGTGLAKAAGEVRVVVVPPVAANETVLAFPNGGEVRDARDGAQSAGFPVAVPPGGRVLVRFDGARYTVTGDGRPAMSVAASRSATAGRARQLPDTSSSTSSSSTSSTSTTTTTVPATSTTTTTVPPTSTTVRASAGAPSSGRTLWAVPAGSGVVDVPARGRRYRGLTEATAAGTPLRLVNHVDVETYLRGMGEVRDPSWPPAALRAQAVAARTYALRAMAAGGELCDDQRCQVYLGAAAEYRAMDKAVADSRGQVVVFGKRLAATVYSANGGGVSATRQEGFGTPDADQSYPYLRSVPYTTQDPLPWSVRVALSDVAARLGYPGQVTDVRVARTGASGRAVEVVLDGAAGQKVVTGIAFDTALGLRSTLFTLRVGMSDSPPPPPPAEGTALQALPDEVAALAPLAGPTVDTAPAQAVPVLPEALPTVAQPGPTNGGRPMVPTALAVLTTLATALLTAGWLVARRAGLSGRALRF
jgi:SpoIID/LytB domain protein